MDSTSKILEENLEKILKGEGLELGEFDLAPEVKPVTLRKNVCYIVSAVIFNSKVKTFLHIFKVSFSKLSSYYNSPSSAELHRISSTNEQYNFTGSMKK